MITIIYELCFQATQTKYYGVRGNYFSLSTGRGGGDSPIRLANIAFVLSLVVNHIHDTLLQVEE